MFERYVEGVRNERRSAGKGEAMFTVEWMKMLQDERRREEIAAARRRLVAVPDAERGGLRRWLGVRIGRTAEAPVASAATSACQPGRAATDVSA